MILREARGHPIINNHALLTHQYGIAGASYGLLEKPIGVKAIHELGGVRTAQLDAPQGADVDHADAGSHRRNLFGHAALFVAWLAIECWPSPKACGHPLRAGSVMPVRDRRVAMGVEPSPGDMTQRFWLHRRPRRGDPGFTHGAISGFCHQARSRQRSMSALGGAHTDRRVAFYQLHIAVTQPRRVHDVLDL